MSLRMVPLQARRMRLHHARGSDAEYLCRVLTRISRRFRLRVGLDADGALSVRTGHTSAA